MGVGVRGRVWVVPLCVAVCPYADGAGGAGWVGAGPKCGAEVRGPGRVGFLVVSVFLRHTVCRSTQRVIGTVPNRNRINSFLLCRYLAGLRLQPLHLRRRAVHARTAAGRPAQKGTALYGNTLPAATTSVRAPAHTRRSFLRQHDVGTPGHTPAFTFPTVQPCFGPHPCHDKRPPDGTPPNAKCPACFTYLCLHPAPPQLPFATLPVTILHCYLALHAFTHTPPGDPPPT